VLLLAYALYLLPFQHSGGSVRLLNAQPQPFS